MNRTLNFSLWIAAGLLERMRTRRLSLRVVDESIGGFAGHGASTCAGFDVVTTLLPGSLASDSR